MSLKVFINEIVELVDTRAYTTLQRPQSALFTQLSVVNLIRNSKSHENSKDNAS